MWSGTAGLFSGLLRPLKGDLKGLPDHQTTLREGLKKGSLKKECLMYRYPWRWQYHDLFIFCTPFQQDVNLMFPVRIDQTLKMQGETNKPSSKKHEKTTNMYGPKWQVTRMPGDFTPLRSCISKAHDVTCAWQKPRGNPWELTGTQKIDFGNPGIPTAFCGKSHHTTPRVPNSLPHWPKCKCMPEN